MVRFKVFLSVLFTLAMTLVLQPAWGDVSNAEKAAIEKALASYRARLSQMKDLPALKHVTGDRYTLESQSKLISFEFEDLASGVFLVNNRKLIFGPNDEAADLRLKIRSLLPTDAANSSSVFLNIAIPPAFAESPSPIDKLETGVDYLVRTATDFFSSSEKKKKKQTNNIPTPPTNLAGNIVSYDNVRYTPDNRCMTQAFWCYLPKFVPALSTCYCNTPYGRVDGRVLGKEAVDQSASKAKSDSKSGR